jgi:hypothetical protein
VLTILSSDSLEAEMAQKEQAFESVTLGHIRSHGCRDLLIYCEATSRLTITQFDKRG